MHSDITHIRIYILLYKCGSLRMSVTEKNSRILNFMRFDFEINSAQYKTTLQQVNFLVKLLITICNVCL